MASSSSLDANRRSASARSSLSGRPLLVHRPPTPYPFHESTGPNDPHVVSPPAPIFGHGANVHGSDTPAPNRILAPPCPCNNCRLDGAHGSPQHVLEHCTRTQRDPLSSAGTSDYYASVEDALGMENAIGLAQPTLVRTFNGVLDPGLVPGSDDNDFGVLSASVCHRADSLLSPASISGDTDLGHAEGEAPLDDHATMVDNAVQLPGNNLANPVLGTENGDVALGTAGIAFDSNNDPLTLPTAEAENPSPTQSVSGNLVDAADPTADGTPPSAPQAPRTLGHTGYNHDDGAVEEFIAAARDTFIDTLDILDDTLAEAQDLLRDAIDARNAAQIEYHSARDLAARRALYTICLICVWVSTSLYIASR